MTSPPNGGSRSALPSRRPACAVLPSRAPFRAVDLRPLEGRRLCRDHRRFAPPPPCVGRPQNLCSSSIIAAICSQFVPGNLRRQP